MYSIANSVGSASLADLVVGSSNSSRGGILLMMVCGALMWRSLAKNFYHVVTLFSSRNN